jgi:drug/metabolite transporter (DMT)-like permease
VTGPRPANAGRATPGRATLLVLVSACCFGSISTLALIATRDGTSLVAVLGARYLLAAAVLAGVAGRAGLRMPRGRALRTTVLGGRGQAAVTYVSLAALRYVSAATLGFLFYTYPAWVTAIAAARGRERLTPRRASALLLSLGGVATMVGAPGTASLHPLGLALALGSALVYALYIPFIDGLQRGTTPAAASAYITLGAGVLFTVVAAATGTLSLPSAGAPLGAVLTLALFCTALAFITFLRGLATLGPVRTAILSTVEPFYTALLGAAVLGQPITGTTVLGGAMIAAAVVLLQTGAAAPDALGATDGRVLPAER